MFDKLKNLFNKKTVIPAPEPSPPKAKKPRKPRKPKKEIKLSAKEQATAAGEPYISILKVDIDPNDINNGSFELDWNDKFIINLIKSGYKIRNDDSDAMIVDRWFQTVARNIALEVYEQQQADPDKRDDVRVIRNRDIGNGRTEVS